MRTFIFFGVIFGTFFFLISPAKAGENSKPNNEISFTTKTLSIDQDSTEYIKNLVKDAAQILRSKGEEAFEEFSKPESRWRKGETYIFVLDKEGNMLLHADPEMENKNQLDLIDVNGKPIIRGLLAAATAHPDKQEGWFHYQWPVPNGLLPRWKSSFVQLVQTPDGKEFIVGSGMYNDRMEREFVINMIEDAAGYIEKEGKEAFDKIYDPAGPFLVKDTYIFVLDTTGVELVNPRFRNLEGRNLIDLKDTEGKFLVQEMFKAVENDSVAWVNYMWPKPGDNQSTQKSTYVKKVQLENAWVLIGAGVYLADAPKTALKGDGITPQDLKNFVKDAAAKLQQEGEEAFKDFKVKDSKWFEKDKYLFVWTLDGERIFHAADPTLEGEIVNGTKDALGRPYGKMFLETASSKAGEGWVHYMFPEPGDIFPAWKSSYIQHVSFPSGKDHLVGSGIYNMKMNEFLIEEMVNQAASLIEEEGEKAFDLLRDKKGPFFFMDTYIFVTSSEGTELVNPAMPSLEGKNMIDMTDMDGNFIVKKEIEMALEKDSGWLEMAWFKPGTNSPATKKTFVKKVEYNEKTYIVGSGYYPENE